MPELKTGDRVKVIEQDIWGEIVRMDEVKAVVLDDDRDEWMEEDEEGTLIFRLSELEREGLMPDICEQIQEDLLTFLDGMESSILDGVCQIVVDNFKKERKG